MNSNDERSIVSVKDDGIIEGNNDVSVLNSNRSTFKIDSLSIKLGIIKEKPGTVRKCRHFSIRGFTAGKREKGSSKFLRFTDELPPMDVPNFKYWLCQGCNLKNHETLNASLETPFVPVCDQCMVRPGKTSCTTQVLGEVSIVPFGDVGTSGSKAINNKNDDDERNLVDDVIRDAQEIGKSYSVDTNVSEPANKVSNDLETNEEIEKTSVVKETMSNLVSQPIELGQQNDYPNGHPRRKARKVRLLKELLCGKAEIQQQKMDNSSPSVAVSAQIKRKMLPDHDHPHDHDHDHNHHANQDHDQSKKVKSFNKGSEIGIAKNNVMEIRTDPVAREIGENVNKFQWNKPKSCNLGKVGSDAMTAWRSIFSDMGKTDNQIPSSYGVSKGRGTEHYSNFMAPPKPDKKLNALKKICTNKPQKSKFYVEDSRRMKDHQSDTELGLGLSLNYDRQEQIRSLPSFPNRTPNQDHSRKAGFFLGESSNFPNLKDGSVHDVSNRSHPPRTAALQDQQRLYTPLSYGNCSGHQKLDFSNPNKRTNGVRGYSDVTRPHNHQRQENMFSIGRSDEREVIELMAKNQYERSLGENRPRFLPIGSNQNGIVVSGYRKINMNAGISSSSHHEYVSMIRPSSENVGPTNIRNNPGFTMFDGVTIQSHPKQPSNGMWMSDSGQPQRQHYDSRYQHVPNGNNRGGSHTRVYNPTNMQAYNGSHQNGTVSMPFGQTYAKNMDNDKGKTMIDLDLNVVAPNIVEDHNVMESLNLKNPKHLGSIDSSYANDAIPAMQLLSLMDAGKSSQSQKIIPKPPPCYSQRRSTMTGKATPIVNPHVTYPTLRPGVHNPVGTSFSSVFQSGQNIKMTFSHGQQGYYKPQEDKSRNCRPEDSYTFPLPWHATEDPYKQANRVFGSRFDSSVTDICMVNLNPADFSSPGPENVYMIGVEDLKFKGKSVSGTKEANNLMDQRSKNLTKCINRQQ